MPAISVIMPAYNVEAYVGPAIESALAQTFDDLEVIVVDDGSTDQTAAMAARYIAHDTRVRLLQQPNGGISSARNAALRLARGEYIALLDGDDLWDPTYLAAQLEIFRKRPNVSIVTGNATYLGDVWDGQPARPYPDVRPEPTLETILADEQAVFIMSVFRRTVYDAIGGFDESMRSNEDYDYWLRAAAAAFRFARNDKPLGRYRRRSDSLSANEVRMLRGILYVYAKLRPLVRDRSTELAILDAQVNRFEIDLLAAEARAAIELRDFDAAAMHLDALHRRRRAPSIAVARLMAHWAPSLLSHAYTLRRARHAAGARMPS